MKATWHHWLLILILAALWIPGCSGEPGPANSTPPLAQPAGQLPGSASQTPAQSGSPAGLAGTSNGQPGKETSLALLSGAELLQAVGPAAGWAPAGFGPETIQLALLGYGLEDLGGYEISAGSPEGEAGLLSISLGSALESTGRSVGQVGPLQEDDTFSIGAYSYGSEPGFSGDGTLAIFEANRPTAPGLATIPLELLAVSPNAELLDLAAWNGAIHTQPTAPGWNLFAPCANPALQSIPTALGSLAAFDTLLLGADGAFGGDANTLEHLSTPWAYWLHLDAAEPQRLILVGNQANPLEPIPLETGWRWLGYCGDAPLPPAEALASIAGSYDLVVGQLGAYAPGLPADYQTLSAFRQGQGYLVHMTQPAILEYPAVGSLPPAEPPGCAGVSATPYASLLYGRAYLDGTPAPIGTVIELITPRGERAGCAAVGSGGVFGLSLAFGTDLARNIPGFQDGETITLRMAGCDALSVDWSADYQPSQVTLTVNGSTCSAVTTSNIFLPLIFR